MTPGYVFIGGVDVSEACLAALCEMGLPPSLAVGYDETRTAASGYSDLGPLADRHGFELARTHQVNDPALVERIVSLDPAVIFVIGWSQLIKRELLDAPRHGCIGIHPTDLPEGRGRAPIPWTILKGLERTASTMFFLTEGVDDGDVIGKRFVDVEPRETATTLYAKHRDAHVRLVCSFARELIDGEAPRAPQNDADATYWPARRPDDGAIDPACTAAEVDTLVRAVTRPFPGAFLKRADGSRLVVWSAERRASLGVAVGDVVEADGALALQCSDGALALLETESRAA